MTIAQAIAPIQNTHEALSVEKKHVSKLQEQVGSLKGIVKSRDLKNLQRKLETQTKSCQALAREKETLSRRIEELRQELIERDNTILAQNRDGKSMEAKLKLKEELCENLERDNQSRRLKYRQFLFQW